MWEEECTWPRAGRLSLHQMNRHRRRSAPRVDPSEWARKRGQQLAQAERRRAARAAAAQDGLSELSPRSRVDTSPGLSKHETESHARPLHDPADAGTDPTHVARSDLIDRLEALKSQLSRGAVHETPDSALWPGRTRSDEERLLRREAEATLAAERGRQSHMQDEILGLRQQISAIQTAPASAAHQSGGRPHEFVSARDLSREKDAALERANWLSKERVARQAEREAAELAERLAREAEDAAWAHVRSLVEREATASAPQATDRNAREHVNGYAFSDTDFASTRHPPADADHRGRTRQTTMSGLSESGSESESESGSGSESGSVSGQGQCQGQGQGQSQDQGQG